MTNEQLYLAIGIPVAVNAGLLAMLVAYIRSETQGIHKRMDEMKETWRAELRATRAEIGAEVRAEIQSVRAEICAEFRAEIQSARAEFRADIQSVRAEIAVTNQRITDMNETWRAELRSVRIEIAATNQRIDDLRQDWRTELHRVEEILDARLKHVEQTTP